MQYYYAHTGHKGNLDALRRGVAFIKKQNSEIKLLVNDFRAGIVAKELGQIDSVTIETISDLDLVLELNDSITIDSIEDLPPNFEEYCKNFNVSIVSIDRDRKPLFNEKIIDFSKEANLFIDDVYKDTGNKTQRVVFFGGDSDHCKSILKQKEFFKDLNSDLLLGHYFFVNYENEIKNFFNNLYESEDYQEVITTSSDIITTSMQCALEAKASCANVILITENKLNSCIASLLENKNINILYEYNLSEANSLLLTNI